MIGVFYHYICNRLEYMLTLSGKTATEILLTELD
jgi:hypothetical protein